MRRLALGTAQFGLKYGVANSAGQVSAEAVARILARAAASEVDTLDTAIAYGDSEKVLGRAGVAGWKVISKLPPLPPEIADVRVWVRDQIAASRARLDCDRLDALLLHRPADLLGRHGADYQDSLAQALAQGVTRAVGVSIYDPSELDALWPTWRPQIVQAPLNVLDRRLIASGWLAKLAAHGVRVHVRSVFLQGLLLMSADRRPAWFAPWTELLDGWLAWCAQRGLAPQRAAIGFVAAQPEVERYVIGLDSVEQLDELLALSPELAELPPANLSSADLSLIEPSRWKLQ